MMTIYTVLAWLVWFAAIVIVGEGSAAPLFWKCYPRLHHVAFFSVLVAFVPLVVLVFWIALGNSGGGCALSDCNGFRGE